MIWTILKEATIFIAGMFIGAVVLLSAADKCWETKTAMMCIWKD